MNSGAPGKLAVGRVKFFSPHHGEVNSSTFSPDGQTLLTASDDGCVYGWDTPSRRLLWRLGGHTAPPVTSIRLWDVARAKCLQVLKGHQRNVETVSFSPDSKQLASGGWDKHVMLWEVQLRALSSSLVRCCALVGHCDSVQSSDFSPSADCLTHGSCPHVTGCWDSTLFIWDLRVGTPTVSHQELVGHSGNISCLCHSASGILVSGSWDKTIHTWKPTTSSLPVQLKGHVTWVKSIAFSPDESQLASAGYFRLVKIWDCNTGKCLETLKGVLDVAHACAFTPDGKLLVSGAADQARSQVHHKTKRPRAPRV